MLLIISSFNDNDGIQIPIVYHTKCYDFVLLLCCWDLRACFVLVFTKTLNVKQEKKFTQVLASHKITQRSVLLWSDLIWHIMILIL